VHYFDPHSPYHLRQEFSNFPESGHAAHVSPSQDEAIRKRIAEYDSEVAYTDHYIGKLLATVDTLKLRKSTLIVLTADHGESLGEHSYVGHGRHLYENIVRIPLIVRLPGIVEAGKVVDRGVSLLDITPTIVDLTVSRNGKKFRFRVAAWHPC
jgi:choline-sulfatase